LNAKFTVEIRDAPRVAAELGHTSPQMLYSTYRELVLSAEAKRYWKIEPATEAANVVANCIFFLDFQA
jgi:hypothetical protein